MLYPLFLLFNCVRIENRKETVFIFTKETKKHTNKQCYVLSIWLSHGQKMPFAGEFLRKPHLSFYLYYCACKKRKKQIKETKKTH